MNIAIPVLRRVLPAVLAEQLINAQPMTGNVGQIFNFKTVTEREQPKQGDRQHSFIYGWQRYYGTEWIPEWLWINIKLKGL